MIDFETVDTQGDIWFIRGEGVIISFQEIDDTNTPVPSSTHPRYLAVPQLGIHQLIPEDPSLSGGWRIELSPEQLHPVPRVGSVVFSVTDEQGLYPLSLWSGVIRERNLFS